MSSKEARRVLANPCWYDEASFLWAFEILEEDGVA